MGANIGALTLPVARCVGERGHVLALEPVPRMAALLRRTVALNKMSAWVDVQDCAAGEIDGTTRFALSDQTTHSPYTRQDRTREAIDVSVHRLDNLSAAGRRVDVVKIAVEGGELQVWRGMQRIVDENPSLAVILQFAPVHLRRAGVTVASYFAELTSVGHVPWEIDEATGLVSRLREQGLEDADKVNVLLLRDHPESRGLRVT